MKMLARKFFVAWLAVMAFLMLSISGCGIIQDGKVKNALEVVDNVVKAANVVCSTIEVFSKPSSISSKQMNFPDVINVEQSKKVVNKAVEYRESPQVSAVLTSNDCIQENKGDSYAIAECIDGVDGWKLLLDSFEKAQVFKKPD